MTEINLREFKESLKGEPMNKLIEQTLDEVFKNAEIDGLQLMFVKDWPENLHVFRALVNEYAKFKYCNPLLLDYEKDKVYCLTITAEDQIMKIIHDENINTDNINRYKVDILLAAMEDLAYKYIEKIKNETAYN